MKYLRAILATLLLMSTLTANSMLPEWESDWDYNEDGDYVYMSWPVTHRSLVALYDMLRGRR